MTKDMHMYGFLWVRTGPRVSTQSKRFVLTENYTVSSPLSFFTFQKENVIYNTKGWLTIRKEMTVFLSIASREET